jgi:hypothetical protein
LTTGLFIIFRASPSNGFPNQMYVFKFCFKNFLLLKKERQSEQNFREAVNTAEKRL